MVITNVNQVVYQGDGVTTAFPFTFRIIDATDIKLLLLDSDGTETDILSDYFVDTENDTVHYPGYAPGAEPALSDRPPVLSEGQKLVIYRKLPITQEKDLGDKWPFYVIELGLDKLTMILQDIWDWLGRCLYVSKGQAYEAGDDFDPTIPLEADKVICGNENGTGFDAREAVMEVNGAWDGEGRQIHSVADPTADQDAATKKYTDTRMDSNFMKLQPDGTAWEGRNLPISNVANPTLQQQVTTKNYVDSIIAGIVAAGNNVIVVDNVATMKATDLTDGMYVTTAGYHEVNDGGNGFYAVRASQVGDVDDGGSIIFLDNGNVAEKINVLNASNFSGDNDAEILQNAIDFAEANNYRTIIINRKFDITGHSITAKLPEADNYRNYLRLVGIGVGEIYKGDSGYMFVHDATSSDPLTHGLTFENLTLSGEPSVFAYDENQYDNNCDVIDASTLIRTSFINCFFKFIRDAIHGESGYNQSNSIIRCTLLASRSLVYAAETCGTTDLNLNNNIVERSVMMARFDDSVVVARITNNVCEGCIYGLVFRKTYGLPTCTLKNVGIANNYFEQNNKESLILHSTYYSSVYIRDNAFMLNAVTGYPMITIDAAGYQSELSIFFAFNSFAGAGATSLCFNIETANGQRNTIGVAWLGTGVHGTYFTNLPNYFLDLSSFSLGARQTPARQIAGETFTIADNQVAYWKDANTGMMFLHFPFIMRNTNYIVTVNSLALETVGTIDPTTEIAIQDKTVTGCTIKINHSQTAGVIRITYLFNVTLTFA